MGRSRRRGRGGERERHSAPPQVRIEPLLRVGHQNIIGLEPTVGEDQVQFTSVTRLRLRSRRFAPFFAVHTWKSLRQVKIADGYLSGSLLADRKLTFWTMTIWRDEGDMRRYATSGAHRRAMHKLVKWCDEASVVHWTSEAGLDPDWAEADRRMRGEGRASKVRHPSPQHSTLAYDQPEIFRAVSIRAPRTPRNLG